MEAWAEGDRVGIHSTGGLPVELNPDPLPNDDQLLDQALVEEVSAQLLPCYLAAALFE